MKFNITDATISYKLENNHQNESRHYAYLAMLFHANFKVQELELKEHQGSLTVHRTCELLLTIF